MKTVKIETNLWEDVEDGDRIEVVREDCRYLGVSVEGNKGRLYVSEKSFGRRASTHRTYINQIPEEWELVSIVRDDPESKLQPKTDLKWKFSDIFKKKAPTRKPGSTDSIKEAIEDVDWVVNYFDTRVQLGDPLFDQWMVDAHESAKSASENLRKLLKAIGGKE